MKKMNERHPESGYALVAVLILLAVIAAILTAYFASSHGWLEQGLEYQLLNLTGAAGVGWVCWLRRTWQPLLLEVAWGLVALSALVGL